MANFKFETMNDKKYRTYYKEKMEKLLCAKYIDMKVIDDYYRCLYYCIIPENRYGNNKYNKNDLQRLALILTVKCFMNRNNISQYFYSENKIEQAKAITLFLQKSFNIKGNKCNNVRLNISEEQYILKDKYNNKVNLLELFEYDKYSIDDSRFLFLNYKTDNSINYLIRKFYDLYQNYTHSNFDTYLLKFDFKDSEDLNYYNHLKKLEKHQLIINENGTRKKNGINQLPIDLYFQEDMFFKFKFGKVNIKIDNVFIYNDFIFEIYCKETENENYKNITSFYNHNQNYYDISKCNKFLILINTQRGAYIYESDFGEFFIDNYIIEKGLSSSGIVYLKNKYDYFDREINIINKDYMLSYYFVGSYKKKLFLKSSFASNQNEMFNDYYFTDIYSQKGLDLKNIALQINEAEILPNLFSDDGSLNYHFRVKKEDIKLNSLLNSFSVNNDIHNAFFCNSDMHCGAIYHVSINKIFDCITTNNINQLIDDFAKKDDDLKKYLYKLKDVCNEIAIKISDKMNIDINDVPMFLYEKYLKKYEVANLRKHYNKVVTNQSINWNVSSVNDMDEHYLNENLKKWKSEYALYTLILNQYPDAVYQYRNSWLGLQSLDIYIPSLKIGVEYQGIQHFKAIEYFGGEEGFKDIKQRDVQKKELCYKNGVMLIEWHYTEPITEILLTNKIEEKMKEGI